MRPPANLLNIALESILPFGKGGKHSNRNLRICAKEVLNYKHERVGYGTCAGSQ